MLVDSHCHLNSHSIYQDIDTIIRRADANQVSTLLTICTNFEELEQITGIIDTYSQIYCSAGLHPLYIDDNMRTVEQIANLCNSHHKIVGIGETGLDYYKGKGSKKEQLQSFEAHIEAAQNTGLPIIVHTREADEDTVHLLEKMYKQRAFKGVIHCFTSSKWLATRCLDIGFYISASGIITFKNAEDIRETFKHIPLSRILVETDAPYLAPVPYRGKVNEPSYVKHTAEFLAELLNIDYQELALQTSKNFFNLFDKAGNEA